ncbi:hypothetical protein SLEP1_g15083 [Rubroshorea leprosula]|uniref:Uncharacterized protein n=1 Tax=Rubroshorea leprosula TaxID=152421 RepID=A0AAV5IV54_9ROSI|nr:hypothetical protein SLEP1_g15083 [Rubroshorea leprosula]
MPQSFLPRVASVHFGEGVVDEPPRPRYVLCLEQAALRPSGGMGPFPLPGARTSAPCSNRLSSGFSSTGRG